MEKRENFSLTTSSELESQISSEEIRLLFTVWKGHEERTSVREDPTLFSSFVFPHSNLGKTFNNCLNSLKLNKSDRVLEAEYTKFPLGAGPSTWWDLLKTFNISETFLSLILCE